MKWSKHIVVTCMLAFLGLVAVPAHAQLFVTNWVGGTVGKYDVSTGATINASFISGLTNPSGIAADDSGNLFVVSFGKIGKYNAVTGEAINESFITGLSGPIGLALDGNGNLFVANFGGTIGKYNASTGAAINPALVSLSHPYGVAVDGNGHLYTTNRSLNQIGKFNAATGAPITNPFVTADSGLRNPIGIAVDESDRLYVANNASDPTRVGLYNADTGATIDVDFVSQGNPWGIALDGDGQLFAVNQGSALNPGNGTIGKYDALTGEVINSKFVTGLQYPQFIAVVVPEPAGMAVVGLLVFGSLGGRARNRPNCHCRPSVGHGI